MPEELVLANDLSELSRLSAWVERMGPELNLPEAIVFAVDLVMEEMVTNVIKYAYADASDLHIAIRGYREGDELVLVIEDQGPRFNPLTAEAPDMDQTLDEMEIGGRGLVLVRQIMDDLAYERRGNRNIFTMKKKLVGSED